MIWTYIKADAFFKDYLPTIRSHKHKIRGFKKTLSKKKEIRALLGG
jgi:hypothetical protein